MKKSIWFIVFVVIMLTSCYSPNKLLASTSQTPLHIQVQESSTTQLVPTSTILIIQPTFETKKACIEINSASKNKSQGIIVFKQDWQSRLTFYDNETENKTFVPPDSSMHVTAEYFSPDQKWLVYELDWGDPNGETKFIFTKADGVQQKELSPSDIPNWSNTFWINNHTVRVADADLASQSIQSLIIDPFLGEKARLRSEFPEIVSDKKINWGIDSQAISMGLYKGTNIVYDPSLLRALYPKSNGLISLYNLETNTEMAQTKISDWGRLPAWSPDGKYLSIIGTMSANPANEDLDEFLLVSRDGPEFQQLTHLTSVFKSVHIERYSWSPDGHKIAFWLKTENTSSDNPANSFELAVLDFQTKQITMHCLTGTPEIEFDTYSRNADLIWSPDGTQLLIAQYAYASKDKKKFDVILVDFAEKIAYKLAENMYQVGWMTKEP